MGDLIWLPARNGPSAAPADEDLSTEAASAISNGGGEPGGKRGLDSRNSSTPCWARLAAVSSRVTLTNPVKLASAFEPIDQRRRRTRGP